MEPCVYYGESVDSEPGPNEDWITGLVKSLNRKEEMGLLPTEERYQKSLEVLRIVLMTSSPNLNIQNHQAKVKKKDHLKRIPWNLYCLEGDQRHEPALFSEKIFLYCSNLINNQTLLFSSLLPCLRIPLSKID
jgi:hypothetical protein